MKRNKQAEIDEKYQVSDALWEVIKPLLPKKKDKKKSGRPTEDDRKMFNALLFIFFTGCQWNALPRSLGASSTVHDRYQYWVEEGLFIKLWEEGLIAYDLSKGIDWQWQSMDGAHNMAPLAGECTGPSYKHRGKTGTNRSILVEANGIPISAVADKANRNDFKLVKPTLEAIIIQRPEPTEEEKQNLCMDKGYDAFEVDEIIEAWGYTAQIKRKGKKPNKKLQVPKYRARRWVVERTHAWLNNYRRLLIRWERKVSNFLGFLHLACALICFRSSGRFA